MKESQRVRVAKSQSNFPLPLRERRVPIQRMGEVRGNIKILFLLLLLAAYCSLLTVTTGCGKKAPPKPPQGKTWIR
ncbi:MAG: hypothetical protein HZB79_00675 [Deltaproteobacteria bacterium]|nr:hypothetical protein [Deltaproteobacteria bacterium]